MSGYGLVSRRNTVVVASGQRGAGASTLAALLGAALAASGGRTLLVDAAGEGGLVELLRVDPGAAARGPVPVGTGLAVTLAPAAGTVGVVTTGWDRLVVDAGSEWEAVSATCVDGVDAVLAAAAPERVSLAAAYALLKALGAAFPDLSVEVVLNRHRAGSRAGDDELRAAAQRFLGWRMGRPWRVPEDACLAAGTAGGMTLWDAAEGSAVAAAVGSIAWKIVEKERAPNGGPAVTTLRTVV